MLWFLQADAPGSADDLSKAEVSPGSLVDRDCLLQQSALTVLQAPCFANKSWTVGCYWLSVHLSPA